MIAWVKQRSQKGQGESLPLVIRLVQILGLIALGWLLIRALILFFNPESAWTSLPAVPNAVNGNSAQVQQTYAFSSDPFAMAITSQVGGSNSISFDDGLDVPETDLNLVLKGRTVGNPGSAVLQTPDNQEKSYRVGEDVMNGVTLQAVRAKFIVLDVRGELQRLTFLRDSTTGLVAERTEPTAVIAPATVKKIKVQNNGVIGSASGVNASELLKTVKFNPYYDQGRLSGYSVSSSKGEAGLKQFGLKAGDVITQVNSTSLLSERLNLLQLAASLRDAKQIKMQIIRDGRPQTVNIGR
jgi:general secretion pathway protein C